MPMLFKPALYIGEFHLVPAELADWKWVKLSSLAEVIKTTARDTFHRYQTMNHDAPLGVMAVMTSTWFAFMPLPQISDLLVSESERTPESEVILDLDDFFVSAGWANDVIKACNAGYFLTQLTEEFWNEGDHMPDYWLKMTPVPGIPDKFYIVSGFKK